MSYADEFWELVDDCNYHEARDLGAAADGDIERRDARIAELEQRLGRASDKSVELHERIAELESIVEAIKDRPCEVPCSVEKGICWRNCGRCPPCRARAALKGEG